MYSDVWDKIIYNNMFKFVVFFNHGFLCILSVLFLYLWGIELVSVLACFGWIMLLTYFLVKYYHE